MKQKLCRQPGSTLASLKSPLHRTQVREFSVDAAEDEEGTGLVFEVVGRGGTAEEEATEGKWLDMTLT